MENIRIQLSIFLRHDGTSVSRHVSIQNLWKMQVFLIMYDLLVDIRHLWQKKSTSLMKFASNLEMSKISHAETFLAKLEFYTE